MTLYPRQTYDFGNIFVIFGRHLEAEGLEKTFKFKQRNIADVVDVTSARKVPRICLDTCLSLSKSTAVEDQ